MAWSIIHPILVAIVIAGAMPLIAGCYQFLLAGFNGFFGVWKREGVPGVPLPRVAVIVPAWNEAAVIGRTLDTLMALDYPRRPPARVRRRRRQHRRDARTSSSARRPSTRAASSTCAANRAARARRTRSTTGCARIRSEDWYEAILIIDADVIFTPRSLRKMARHLTRPRSAR